MKARQLGLASIGAVLTIWCDCTRFRDSRRRHRLRGCGDIDEVLHRRGRPDDGRSRDDIGVVDAQAHERFDEHPDAGIGELRCALRLVSNVAVLREHSERAIGRWEELDGQERIEHRRVPRELLEPSAQPRPQCLGERQRRCPVHRLRPGDVDDEGQAVEHVQRAAWKRSHSTGRRPHRDRDAGRRIARRLRLRHSAEPGDQRPLHRHSHRKGCLRLHADDVWGRRDAFGTLAGAPSYGTFGTWSSGVASASVSASASQTGAKLTATDGAATGTSNAFDVFDAICVATRTAPRTTRQPISDARRLEYAGDHEPVAEHARRCFQLQREQERRRVAA